ncbi:MAG: SGNH/GDSL hydrolase family protein [Candidatus Omnitrophota bacterium]
MFLRSFIIVLGLFFVSNSAMSDRPIRYVALGDSYTIGIGASIDEAWPVVITRRLQKKGVAIELTANLAKGGWTTQDLIEYQLPALKELHPDLVTLLIGTNDLGHGVSVDVFKDHFHFILDKIFEIVHKRENIVVITLPDVTVTPNGKKLSIGRDIAKDLEAFNQVIKKEAQARGIRVVDLDLLSQTIESDSTLVSVDGFHPSAKGYLLWADLIEPAFL